MHNVFPCLLFTLLVAVRFRDVDAQLDDCSGDVCPTTEPNASTCVATNGKCRCDILFVVDAATTGCVPGTCDSTPADSCGGDKLQTVCDTAVATTCRCNIFYEPIGYSCVLKTCDPTSSDTIESSCVTNAACTGTTTKTCACAVNYKVDGQACTAIACDVAASDCTDPNNEHYCEIASGEASGICACKKNFVGTNALTCTRKTCPNGATDCTDANSACHTGATCNCAINFAVASDATEGECTAIPCTSTDATACTDNNAYCKLTSATVGTCDCKINYNGTNALECTTISCTDDANCTEANSACIKTGDAVAGVCGCDKLHSADATTGACARKTCTAENKADTCGTNTVCEQSGSDLKCFCQSNYMGSAAGCVQKTCTGNETADCDENSQCSSDKCICADNFVGTSRVCECPTEFSVVGGVCKKACTATSSECGTNGACFKEFCECEPNYAGTAPTTCTQIACSGTTTTTCAADSSCTSSKCVCSAGSFVEGTDKLVCATAGCKGIFCNFSLLMASLLMFFFAGKRFE